MPKSEASLVDDLAESEGNDEAGKDLGDEAKDGGNVEAAENQGEDAADNVLEDEDEAGKDLAEVAEDDREQDLDVEALDDVEEGANDLEDDGDDDLDETGDLGVGELEDALDSTKGDGDGLDEVDNDVELHLDGGDLHVSGDINDLDDGLVDDGGVGFDGDEQALALLDDIARGGDLGPLGDGIDGVDLVDDVADGLNLVVVDAVVEERAGEGGEEEGAEGEDAGETHIDCGGGVGVGVVEVVCGQRVTEVGWTC